MFLVDFDAWNTSTESNDLRSGFLFRFPFSLGIFLVSVQQKSAIILTLQFPSYLLDPVP